MFDITSRDYPATVTPTATATPAPRPQSNHWLESDPGMGSVLVGE